MTISLQLLEGTPNPAAPLPHLITGGQPGPDTFRRLAEAGVEVILDIRDPMEPRPFDEPALVEELGMRYYNVPVGPGNFDDERLERILDILRQEDGRPTLFHCASGNRVGGAMIAYLMIDKGQSEAEAAAEAMKIGTRSAEVMEWGLSYVQRKSEQ